MNVEIDSLIENTKSWLKALKERGEVWHGVVLMCALQCFEEKKKAGCDVVRTAALEKTEGGAK